MKYKCASAKIESNDAQKKFYQELNDAEKKFYQELCDEGKRIFVLTKDANRQVELIHNLPITPKNLHSVTEMIAAAIIGLSDEMGIRIDDFYDDVGEQIVALLLKNYGE